MPIKRYNRCPKRLYTPDRRVNETSQITRLLKKSSELGPAAQSKVEDREDDGSHQRRNFGIRKVLGTPPR